jgi:beta-lactamase regulating signal transducer with metallopeptidase domain
MNTLSWMIEPAMATRLTLALLHFLWQGCCGGLVVIVCGTLFRDAPARLRYALNVAVLILMAVCLPVTFLLVDIPVMAESKTEVRPTAPEPKSAGSTLDEVPAPSLARIVPPGSEVAETGDIPAASRATPEAGPALAEAHTSHMPPETLLTASTFQSLSRWVATIYLSGVLLIFARLFRGIWGGRRLQKLAQVVDDALLLEMVDKLARRLGLRVVPAIAWCGQISVPVVVGIVQPMILLPLAVVSGLTPHQLQALVLHELAHIRRFDPIVNLLQRFIEAVLFFHPMVWFVSRRISVLREHAADDMVLAAGWDRPVYADALVRAAELASAFASPDFARRATLLGASGTSQTEFKLRVLRLLDDAHAPKLQLSRAGVLSLILIAALGGMLAWLQTENREPAADRNGEAQAAAQRRASMTNPIQAILPNAETLPEEPNANAVGPMDSKAAAHDQADQPSNANPGTEGRSLADAVRDFNKENQQLEQGTDQPALTEEEVIGFIKRSDRKGDAKNLNDQEFAAFKVVAESKQLPKESYLQVDTEESRDTFVVNHLWHVRLMLPAIGHDGFVGLAIRDTKVAEEKIDPRQVAWGQPDAEGLSLGAYFSPKKERYQIGERVRLRLFVRNDGQKAVSTTWPNTSHPMPEDFTVTDEKGTNVTVRKGEDGNWIIPWISGYVSGGLASGDVHRLNVPYEISFGGDGSNKLVGRVIEARAGQTLHVRIRAFNGNNRERGSGDPEPESGSLALTIADAPNAKAAIDPNGVRNASRETDRPAIPQSAAEFEKLLRDNTAKLAEGRLEVSLDYEWRRPTPENPKRTIATQGTMRRIRKGKLLRIDFERQIANPSPQESDFWSESWVTGFDGDLEYSWSPREKSIVYGELHFQSRSLDYWGFARSESPKRSTEPQIAVSREQRDGHEVWDVRIEDGQNKTVTNYFGVRPDRGYLASRIEATSNNQPFARTEFEDIFEPQPGVWAARTTLVDAFYLDRPAKRAGYTAHRTKTTITRLELGTAAGLKDQDFVFKAPQDAQVYKWEGNQQRVTPAGFCQATLQFLAGQKQAPLAGLHVEITNGHGDRQKSMGTFTTDSQGAIDFRLPAAFYSLHLKSDKELPYLPVEKLWDGQTRGPQPDLSLKLTPTGAEKWLGGKRRDAEPAATPAATTQDRITYTLLPACELILRAVDAETGQGLPGAEFYEENAVGEDWGHPIFAENIGSKLVESNQAPVPPAAWLTDRDGNFQRLVSANAGYTYFVWKSPPGYEPLEPGKEVEIKIVYGQQRAEHVFKFTRTKTAMKGVKRDEVAQSEKPTSSPAVAPTKTGEKSQIPPDHFQVSFHETPWKDVLSWYGRVLGTQIDLNVVPPGSFSYASPRPLNRVEIIQLIKGELLRRDYCFAESEGRLSIQSADLVARLYEKALRDEFMHGRELRQGSDKFDSYFEIVNVRVVQASQPPAPSGPAIAYVLKANRDFSAKEATAFWRACIAENSITSLKTGQPIVVNGFAVLSQGKWLGTTIPALKKGERIEIWQNEFEEWNPRPPSDLRIAIEGRLVGEGGRPVPGRIRQFLLEGAAEGTDQDLSSFLNWAYGGEPIVDREGHFQIALRHGTQFVRTAYLYAFAPGYAPQRIGPIAVGYEKPTIPLVIELKPGFTARLQLVQANGQPLERGEVEIVTQDDLQAQGIPLSTLPIDGKPISVPHCPPGLLLLKVRVPGFAEQEVRDVRLTAERVTEVKVVSE